ncbi:hypothetical protein D3C87_2151620 [compost metagenome]
MIADIGNAAVKRLGYIHKSECCRSQSGNRREGGAELTEVDAPDFRDIHKSPIWQTGRIVTASTGDISSERRVK